MSRDHRSVIGLRAVWPMSLAGGLFFGFPTQNAEACGGFFCDGQNPIVQTGEQIIFSVEPAEQKVEAIINIRYQGSPRDFAWILPLESEPTKVDVGPAAAFSVANNLTSPRFVVTTEEEGFCTSVPTAIRLSDEFAPKSVANAVNVLQQREIGPYESVVISASDPEAARMWLVEHQYSVTDEMMKSVTPYVQKGDVLLALRLNNDQDVGDIQPIWLELQAERPCVPIRLTAIAASQDLDLTTVVLSNVGRAIPSNYFHVDLNLAKIDWLRGGSNYRQIVSEAADEGQGNAFVTEYSGSARVFDNRIYTPGTYDRGLLLAQTDARSFVEAAANQGFLSKQEAAGILARGLPDEAFANLSRAQFLGCPQCSTFSIQPAAIDPSAMVDELWARIVEPEIAAQHLFDKFRYATRLYTLLSPEEMTIDPEFSFRSDLPDVSNVHNATMYLECGLGRSTTSAPRRLFIEETGQTLEFEPTDQGAIDRTQLDAMPAAIRIEQLEEGTLISDRSQEIEDLIDAHNGAGACGCSTSRSSGSAWAALFPVALMAWARRRRPRRV